ncbi:hypothetical protein OQJ46_16480 [Microbulbifer thermotolerans]|uniref:hypothetical protein n=1 Tax=Microbulbifer thermotolerans TaxID=252514 RepID=UPI0022498DBB|nr:hypothetical protein [Microbulbifer thermotolerans]MCX2778971.1 hypothetical protein [Microbulbifer thermotolerans]MCX2784589.1 hypothetical protein [Microbulbifer thermotolerans]MCX2793902.1 hypothetical protein [Microbulbifer thermotolerans]MCX2806437.1 hypothetical protein [Microbulbifer thermotolerans]MCX2833095.1 hypothetical protein [Microbulbifer thermotolerans]
MSYEWLKYISPLLGVGLGAWLAPYIERRKASAESRNALKAFYSELEDYLRDAPTYVKNFHSGYAKVKKLEAGIIKNDLEFFPISLAPKIEFLTIDNVIAKSFLQLTYDQRKAIRALVSLSNAINEKTDLLSKGREIPDFIDKKSKFWSAARMSASFYYVVSRLYHEKERFVYHNESNDERCKKALDALNLSFEFKGLLQGNA